MTRFQWTLPAPYQPSTLSLAAAAAMQIGRSLWRALKHRHAAAALARMDDRMLADIGLTRSDLRDAYSEPLWADPTAILASRARERRTVRRTAMRQLGAWSPSITPEAGFSAPRTDRPARYTL